MARTSPQLSNWRWTWGRRLGTCSRKASLPARLGLLRELHSRSPGLGCALNTRDRQLVQDSFDCCLVDFSISFELLTLAYTAHFALSRGSRLRTSPPSWSARRSSREKTRRGSHGYHTTGRLQKIIAKFSVIAYQHQNRAVSAALYTNSFKTELRTSLDHQALSWDRTHSIQILRSLE